MGVVSPVSLSLEGLWEALTCGRSGVRPLVSDGGVPLPIRYSSAITDFTGDVEQFGELDANLNKSIRKASKTMSREILMAVAATNLALNNARWSQGQIPPQRVGVSFGSDYIVTTPEELMTGVQTCITDGKFDFTRWAAKGLPKMTPLWQLKYLPNMPASHVAILNDFEGPSNSMTLREASVGAVIGESVNIIRNGKADAMLVGTTGTRVHPYKLVQAIQLEDLTPPDADPVTACRPFDRDRCGTVLGEGAGAMLLESEQSAQKRGATILAEVVAGTYSSTFDKSGNDRREETLVRVMKRLFELTETKPNEIGHINAHGLGSISCDRAESQAIKKIFGDYDIPVTTAKGNFGNLGAGSGTIELIAGVLTIKNQTLFPTLNYKTHAPDCPIKVVKEEQTTKNQSFIKLTVNPQSQASAVLVRKYE
jgi:3-oxoacyl-[acyl-carrier-protein] synthase II